MWFSFGEFGISDRCNGTMINDLKGYLMLGWVGLSINWLRFKESQIDFKPSETHDNQLRFRSPTETKSPELNPETDRKRTKSR